MIRVAYKLSVEESAEPSIVRVEITDPDGVSWREAKKQLRQWYLDRAAALRGLTESTYFKPEEAVW